jgi:protein-L-isoaspartate(D-aspartate) O-methyltransferase
LSDELEKALAELRDRMVTEIRGHAARTLPAPHEIGEEVLAALGRVPRHAFVPEELVPFAYIDSPLPIGHGKTISQPFIVALMTALLDVRPGDRVLEVGTGLGYQAAVLAELAAEVYTIEIIAELAEEAALNFEGRTGIHTRIGDGARGWLDAAPFDRVLVAAAPEMIPPALLAQLRPGGRMVIPAGIENDQKLYLVEKTAAGETLTEEVLAVRFSPLVLSH